MALTKVTGHVIKSDTNITSHNINSSGIITAISFDGNVSGVAVTFTGDSTIGSLGITTNLNVGGISTFTGNIDANGDLDVDGHTNLDNVSVAGVSTFQKNVRISDGHRLQLGNSQDLQIWHTSGYNFIDAVTGSAGFFIRGRNNTTLQQPILRIRNDGNTEDIAKFTQGGSVELYHSNTKRLETTNTGAVVSGILTVTGNMNVEGVLTYQDVTNIDSIGIITARAGLNVQAGQTYMGNTTIAGVSTFNSLLRVRETNNTAYSATASPDAFSVGNINSSANTNFTGIHLFTDGNGRGVVNLNALNNSTNASADFTIQTRHNGTLAEKLRITSSGEVKIPTGSNSTSRLTLGDAIDIYHDGNTKFENITGYLKLQSNSNLYIDGSELFFRNAGGTNRWKIDSSGHFLPGAVGSYNIGSTGAEIGNVYIADSKHVYWGSDQDLAIVHNGTHGYIHAITGGLYMKVGNGEFLSRNGNQVIAKFLEGTGGVELWYNNVKKFDTVETGITVTGEVAASQDYPNFRPTLDFNFAAEKKLDPRITYSRTGSASFVNEFGKVVLVGDNVPRFDHDPVTKESKGLLIEESRTNLVTDNTNYTGWTNYSATHAKTTDVKAPDGSFNAWKVTSTGVQSQFGIYDAISYTANTKYTHSMWLKAGTATRVGLTVSSGTRWSPMPYLVVDLDTGTVNATGSSLSTKLTAYPNGWYLLEATGQFGSSSTSDGIWSYTAQTGGFSGNTTAYYYQWGGQAEAGAFATSFIPTNGSTATRGADFALIDGEEFTEFFNQDQGTIITSTNSLNTSATQYPMVIEGDNTNNERHIFVEANAYQYQIKDGGSTMAQIDAGSISTKNIIAAAYKLNDTAVSINGSDAATDTSATMPTCTQLKLGHWSTTVYNGYINRFIYYSNKISNSQLKTLSS